MYNELIIGLALGILISLTTSTTHAMQSRLPNTTETMRIIGATAAIGGIAALTYGTARPRFSSFFGGLVLLGGGTATVLGAERIVEEINRYVTKPGFFNYWSRTLKDKTQQGE